MTFNDRYILLDDVANTAYVYLPLIGGATLPLSTYFNTIRQGFPNLGFLPPVTKLITSIDDNNCFKVIVEAAPKIRTLMLQDAYTNETEIVETPFPWHSYIFTFKRHSKTPISLMDVTLLFQQRQIQSDLDLVNGFFSLPWLPNVSTAHNLILPLTISKYLTTDMNAFYRVFLDSFWNNYIVTKPSPSLDLHAKEQLDSFEKIINFFENLQSKTLDWACDSTNHIKLNDYNDSDLLYLLSPSSFNLSFKFENLFKV